MLPWVDMAGTVSALGNSCWERDRRMAERGARPNVPAWRLRLLRGLRALFTPLLPDDYLELINPLWSTQELRGRIARIERHIGAAGLENCQQSHDHLEAALDADAHPRIRLDAQLSERVGQLISSAVQLRITQLLVL